MFNECEVDTQILLYFFAHIVTEYVERIKVYQATQLFARYQLVMEKLKPNWSVSVNLL